MSVLNLCSCRFDIMLQSIVSNKSLKLADGNSLAFFATDTLSLTLGFLWADTTTDSRKCGR